MLYESVQAHIGELLPVGAYKPFPDYADRAAWDRVSGVVRGYYTGAAQGLHDAELFPLRATRYMDFYRNGNRKRYENIYFPRRNNLTALMLAECLRGDGAYLDDIIDHVWAICEETTWVVPAHNSGRDDIPHELCDFEAPVHIDLFAAETGSVLTWVYYFLGDVIALRAPLVKRRIEAEVKRRILDPFLADDSFWWKGFGERTVNNWNPWINSNVLPVFLIMEKDEKRRREGVLLTAKSAQNFIDAYEPDGGCDEGPGYFSAAGASLLDYLEIIGGATGGAVDLYGEPLIQNMVRYIYRVHISKSWFVNFADAAARVFVSANLLERVGKRIGDDMLTGFARYIEANRLSEVPYEGAHPHNGFRVHRQLMDFFTHEAVRPEDAPCRTPKGHMFDGIQVMTARMKEDSDEGVFAAVKGGHNGESHNHNDVGSFILYRDGKPVVIDAGVETYTKKTFGERRYEIWTMQSDYHNLPTLNGFAQMPGRDARAEDVLHTDDGNKASFQLNLAAAYPKEAGVLEYRRSFAYDRNAQTVTVQDGYSLEHAAEPVIMNLLCYNQPAVGKPGAIGLGGLTLTYEADEFDPAIEEIELTDDKIKNDWGKDRLYRIRLKARANSRTGSFILRFNP